MIWQCLNYVRKNHSYTFDLPELHLDDKPVTTLAKLDKLIEFS